MLEKPLSLLFPPCASLCNCVLWKTWTFSVIEKEKCIKTSKGGEKGELDCPQFGQGWPRDGKAWWGKRDSFRPFHQVSSPLIFALRILQRGWGVTFAIFLFPFCILFFLDLFKRFSVLQICLRSSLFKHIICHMIIGKCGCKQARARKQLQKEYD